VQRTLCPYGWARGTYTSPFGAAFSSTPCSARRAASRAAPAASRWSAGIRKASRGPYVAVAARARASAFFRKPPESSFGSIRTGVANRAEATSVRRPETFFHQAVFFVPPGQ
jgi:hypothetical protein